MGSSFSSLFLNLTLNIFSILSRKKDKTDIEIDCLKRNIFIMYIIPNILTFILNIGTLNVSRF